jgi:hypothetical protein
MEGLGYGGYDEGLGLGVWRARRKEVPLAEEGTGSWKVP